MQSNREEDASRFLSPQVQDASTASYKLQHTSLLPCSTKAVCLVNPEEQDRETMVLLGS